ncbi:hypothetical protein EON80_27645 [bacterium]|nr:MAG: hypothetical protein EON80_27645 [bacterium]
MNDPASAFHYSATALGIAGLAFSLRLQLLSGPGFEDRIEEAQSRINEDSDSYAAILALIAMSLMFVFQSACWLLAWIVSDIWPRISYLVPIAAWIALLLGIWSLSLHRPHTTVLKRIERNYLRASVGINFVLALAITHFYMLMK